MTRKGWLLFAAISIFWGIPYLFIKVAVRELDLTVAAGSDLCAPDSRVAHAPPYPVPPDRPVCRAASTPQ